MECKSFKIAGEDFVQLGRYCMPVRRIVCFNLDAPNGGCDNSVEVILRDPEETWMYAYENADAVRAFLDVTYERKEIR